MRSAAEVVENENVFVAEALIENDDLKLRPGMVGTAKIRVGRKPLANLFFDDVANYLRLRVWIW